MLPTRIQSHESRSAPRQRGLGALGNVVLLTFLSLFIYSAYRVLPFYYYYFELRNQMAAITANATGVGDVEIRKRVAKVVEELGIPAAGDEVVIERLPNAVRVKLTYEELFYVEFFGRSYDIWRFPFIAEAEGYLD